MVNVTQAKNLPTDPGFRMFRVALEYGNQRIFETSPKPAHDAKFADGRFDLTVNDERLPIYVIVTNAETHDMIFCSELRFDAEGICGKDDANNNIVISHTLENNEPDLAALGFNIQVIVDTQYQPNSVPQLVNRVERDE